MPAFPRPLLLLTHVSALAVGCWLAMPDTKSDPEVISTTAQASPPKQSGTRASNSQPSSVTSLPGGPREFAAAWELLRREKLPRDERKALQEALLEKWSLVDLEAALRASLAELGNTRGILPGLPFAGEIVGCDPGIAAHPELALQLIRDKTLGFGTVNLRKQWLAVLREKPELLFTALNELTGDDRSSVLECLANSLADPETDASTKQAIITGTLSLRDRPEGKQDFREIATGLAESVPNAELERQVNEASDPAKRALYLSAFAQSLAASLISEPGSDPFSAEDDPFSDSADTSAKRSVTEVWESLAPGLRSEVAAEGLHTDNWDGDMTFAFARQALADGNLDALKAAVEHEGFGRYADNTKQPVELADWALTLPDDPRTSGLYLRAMQGASVRDFTSIREKILALPPGWQRDHGIAALEYGGHYSDQAVGEIERLLERIQDPALRERAKKDYRERREADGQ